MDVSIIIVSYNTKELTLNCLDSIVKFGSGLTYEIIVVDNNSQDGTVEAIDALAINVLLLKLKENLGFGRANNLGVRYARGKYLLFLNSDTVFIENSLVIFKNYLDREDCKNVAVLGCSLLTENLLPGPSYGNFPSLIQEIFSLGLSKIFKRYYDEELSPSVAGIGNKIKEVDYIIGADLFVRKEVFDIIGGFDEDFFLYYEETELCFRLKKSGYSIHWLPFTAIIHYIGSSGKSDQGVSKFIMDQLVISRHIYYKKCHGYIYAFCVDILILPRLIFKHTVYFWSGGWNLYLKVLFNRY